MTGFYANHGVAAPGSSPDALTVLSFSTAPPLVGGYIPYPPFLSASLPLYQGEAASAGELRCSLQHRVKSRRSGRRENPCASFGLPVMDTGGEPFSLKWAAPLHRFPLIFVSRSPWRRWIPPYGFFAQTHDKPRPTLPLQPTDDAIYSLEESSPFLRNTFISPRTVDGFRVPGFPLNLRSAV